MDDTLPAERLYLVTPQIVDPDPFGHHLEQVLSAVPVACLRVDLGDAAEAEWRSVLNHLIGPCHAHDVALIVTDHFRLVEPLGLDGVHLSHSRMSVRDVRKELGKDRIVGAAAGTSRHQGLILAEAEADYVSFGPVGDTGVLGDDARAEDDLFAWWTEVVETQCVAEGGVSVEDAERLADITDFVVPDRRIWDDAATVIEVLKRYAAALDAAQA